LDFSRSEFFAGSPAGLGVNGDSPGSMGLEGNGAFSPDGPGSLPLGKDGSLLGVGDPLPPSPPGLISGGVSAGMSPGTGSMLSGLIDGAVRVPGASRPG